MTYGYGYGFRGWSPPWPYVGRGRGGLPRCWYFGPPVAPPYWPGMQVGQVPYPPYAAPFYGAPPYAPQMTREQELDFLKEQAEAVKEQLAEIEARIGQLEIKEEQS